MKEIVKIFIPMWYKTKLLFSFGHMKHTCELNDKIINLDRSINFKSIKYKINIFYIEYKYKSKEYKI